MISSRSLASISTDNLTEKESFPLMKLPILALDRVLLFNVPIERMSLSQCSNKTKRFLAARKMKVPLVYITTAPSSSDMGILYGRSLELQMTSQKKEPKASDAPEESSEDELICQDRDSNGKMITIRKLKNDKKGLSVECDDGVSNRERTLFMANLLFELFTPEHVRWQFDPENIPDRELAELCRLVQSPQFSAPPIRMETRLLTVDPAKAQIIIDNIGPVHDFCVNKFVPSPQRLRNRFNFPNVNYGDGRWLVIQMLPRQLRICESLKFSKTEVTNGDVNHFFRGWRRDGIRKLRKLQFYLHWGLEPKVEMMFQKIPTLQVVKDEMNTWFLAPKFETGLGLDLASVHFERRVESGRERIRVVFLTYLNSQHVDERRIVDLLHKKRKLGKKMVRIETRIREITAAMWRVARGSHEEDGLREKLDDMKWEKIQLQPCLEEISSDLRTENVQFVDEQAVLRQ